MSERQVGSGWQAGSQSPLSGRLSFRPSAKIILAVLMWLAVLWQSVSAATISGTVYDYSLSPAHGAFVTINTMPKQQYVAANATYSFYVPLGKYNITATLDTGSLAYYSMESIIVTGNEEYVLDIILLPLTDDADNLSDLPVYEYEPMFSKRTDQGAAWLLAGFIVGAAILMAAIVLYSRLVNRKVDGERGDRRRTEGRKHEAEKRSGRQQEMEGHPGQSAEKDLQGDKAGHELDSSKEEWGGADPENAVLELIRRSKRVTQKEIRKAIPYSEAKISLVISDLESQGKIRKIRKGRGNIIVFCG